MKVLTSLLLSLVLALTAQGAAFARGQSPASDQRVICTGHGSVLVFVDENGAPTSPPQLCFDAAQALFAALAVEAVVIARPEKVRTVRHSAPQIARAPVASHTPLARGPPLESA